MAQHVRASLSQPGKAHSTVCSKRLRQQALKRSPNERHSRQRPLLHLGRLPSSSPSVLLSALVKRLLSALVQRLAQRLGSQAPVCFVCRFRVLVPAADVPLLCPARRRSVLHHPQSRHRWRCFRRRQTRPVRQGGCPRQHADTPALQPCWEQPRSQGAPSSYAASHNYTSVVCACSPRLCVRAG